MGLGLGSGSGLGLGSESGLGLRLGLQGAALSPVLHLLIKKYFLHGQKPRAIA